MAREFEYNGYVYSAITDNGFSMPHSRFVPMAVKVHYKRIKEGLMRCNEEIGTGEYKAAKRKFKKQARRDI